MTPNVASTVTMTELSDDQAGDAPPTLSVPEIQHIGVNQCAIPPEELSEDVLLAGSEDGPSTT